MLPLHSLRAKRSGALWVLGLVLALFAPALSSAQREGLRLEQRRAVRHDAPTGFLLAGAVFNMSAWRPRPGGPAPTGSFAAMPFTLPVGVTHSTFDNSISGTPLTLRYQDNQQTSILDLDSSLGTDSVTNFNVLQAQITADAGTNTRRVYEVGSTRQFYGTLSLPHNAGAGWSVIRPVGYSYVSSLTTPPSLSMVAPTFMSGTSNTPTIGTAITGAADQNHGRWALMGIKVTLDPAFATTSTSIWNAGLVRVGDAVSQNALNKVPDGFLIHDCLLVGNSGQWIRRGVENQGQNFLMRATRVDEIHSNAPGGSSFDSQPVWGWNGPGPYEFCYNVLQGGDEAFGFGGGGALITNLNPSDTYFHHNTVYKTSAYMTSWGHKNFLEHKTGLRALYYGNELYGLGAFTGGTNNQAYGIIAKSTGSGVSGGNLWNVTQDIHYFQNRLRDMPAMFSMVGFEGTVTTQTNRVAVIDNIGHNINVSPYTDGTRRTVMAVTGTVADIVLMHNTVAQSSSTDAAIFLNAASNNGGQPSAPRIKLKYNLLPVCGTFNTSVGGVWSSAGQGTAVLNDAAPGPTWEYEGMHWVGTSASTSNYPSGKSTTWANLAAVPFVDSATGNLRINAGGTNANLLIGAAPSGKNIGVQDPDQVYAQVALCPAA